MEVQKLTFLTVAASVQISRYTACCWPTRTTELLAQNSYFRNSGEWVPNPLFYAPLFPLDIFKGWSTFLEHCVSWQVFEMFPWPFSVPMALARVSELKWWQKWSDECLFFDNIGIAKIQNWLGWKGFLNDTIIKQFRFQFL